LERLDYLDVTPVVGWNDKVLRLLAALLPPDEPIPEGRVSTECLIPVTVGTEKGWYHETRNKMSVMAEIGRTVFHWSKSASWSRAEGEVMIR
jgi:hypothetical protein